MMIWTIDAPTQQAAQQFPVLVAADQPIAQFGGHQFIAATWQRRLLPGQHFRQQVFQSSPQEIIGAFQAGHDLQALALIVSWGGMGRQQQRIYGHSLDEIQEALSQCMDSIRQTDSIQRAWDLLTGELGWTAVMTSKTLHFLSRALNDDEDRLPVPIDNRVIRDRVWPAFKNAIPHGQRPLAWRGNTFAPYQRYMTAILEWSAMRNWTTTQFEPTLFAEYNG